MLLHLPAGGRTNQQTMGLALDNANKVHCSFSLLELNAVFGLWH